MKQVFFSSSTEYYLDGYPRSGNTYLCNLTKRIFPQKNVVHHLHVIAAIKIAIRKELTVFILFRKPSDCISSNYLMHFSMRNMKPPNEVDMRLLSHMVSWYLDYYSYVLENKKCINLLHFDNLIGNTSSVIHDISIKLNQNLEIDDIQKRVANINKIYKDSNKINKGSKSKYGSSTPNKYKEEKKDSLKKSMYKLSDYEQCESIYQRLLSVNDEV